MLVEIDERSDFHDEQMHIQYHTNNCTPAHYIRSPAANAAGDLTHNTSNQRISHHTQLSIRDSGQGGHLQQVPLEESGRRAYNQGKVFPQRSPLPCTARDSLMYCTGRT